MKTVLRVPSGDGEIDVVELGGTGRAVLLVHNVGENVAAWGAVRAALTPGYQVLAMDLPGHGQSTTEARTAEDYVTAIANVYRALDQPIVVADEVVAFHCVAAAAREPGRVSGIVAISGALLMTKEALQEVVDIASTAEGVRVVTEERFALGEVVSSDEDRRRVIEEQVVIEMEGWRGDGLTEEESRDAFERSFLNRGDGTWIRRPTEEGAASFFRMDLDAPHAPSLQLVAQTEVPVHMILSITGGDAAVLGEDRRYTGELPDNATLTLVDGGVVPRRLLGREVLEAVEAIAALVS